MSALDKVHIVNSLPPVADAFAGTVYSDVVEAMGQSVSFLVYRGVGTTGSSTITVQACDDTTPANSTAVPFVYREYTSSDVPGDWTAATAAGWTTSVGSNYMFEVKVDPGELAALGYGYVRLKAVESVDDPVLGGILVIIEDLRYREQPESLID